MNMTEDNKNIFHIKKYECCSGNVDSIKENVELHTLLQKYKTLINQYHRVNKWDKYKKYMNPYELVSDCYPSISRSFFKLWEILVDINAKDLFSCKQRPQCLFLAEGPGGFIEAFVKFHHSISNIYGMSLISRNKSVPQWKLKYEYQQLHNISLLSGKDGKGDICNLSNHEYMISLLGKKSCDLITGDGGFDFTNHYEDQEEVSQKLITAEVLSTLQLQGIGGTCIIKFFDICSSTTLSLLYILEQSYTQLLVIKPWTSRPANSEKYVVGLKFVGCRQEHIIKLQHYLKTGIPYQIAQEELAKIIPDVLSMNKYLIKKQIECITDVIDLIENNLHIDVDKLRAKQSMYTSAWIDKYMPHSF
jgi:hypothetical protein